MCDNNEVVIARSVFFFLRKIPDPFDESLILVNRNSQFPLDSHEIPNSLKEFTISTKNLQFHLIPNSIRYCGGKFAISSSIPTPGK